jgi:ABC-type glutathione transport system ATPase component
LDANAVLSRLERPFPGLRPFETEESIFFFGREAQTAELLRRLSESRFLAVTGDSGCGKSSLVYAGLLPALHRGYLVNATTRWRVATLRPGNDPISALAAALAKKGALDALDQEKLRSLLKNGSGGLADAVRQAGFASGESLLVVADQFEELFRFATENPAATAVDRFS